MDPLACALHGVLRHTPRDGDRVLIQGAGIIGLGVTASLRAMGCKAHITALVRHGFQAKLMTGCGADQVIVSPRDDSNARRFDRVAASVGGRRVGASFGNQTMLGGFDAVYDCVGTGQSLADAMKFTRPRGTTLAMGTSQICVLDTTPLWFSELNLIGVYGRQIETGGNGARMHTYRLVMDLISSDKLRTDGLLTHVFELRDYRHAFRTLIERGSAPAIKVAFRHS